MKQATILILLLPVLAVGQSDTIYSKNKTAYLHIGSARDATSHNKLVMGSPNPAEGFVIYSNNSTTSMRLTVGSPAGDAQTTSDWNGFGDSLYYDDSAHWYASPSDSLFLSTDKPTSTWEDNPATLGMEYTVSKRGTIKAVKFYKATTSNKPYTITVWDSTGGKWFEQTITTASTGWQRIPCGLLAEPGMKYTIGVFNNDNRYGYKNGVLPRTRGSISATKGRFGYGTGLPAGSGSCYYLDIVFQADVDPAPVVSISPDSAVYQYGVDSIIVKGVVQNATSYSWEVVDSAGSSRVSGLSGLNPVIYPHDQGGCWVLLMLTARGADGTERSAMADISVMPDPKETVGVITRDGHIIWLKQIIVTKPFQVGP